MNGRQLVLNDGTIIPNGEAGLSSGFLWCYLPGFTIQQAASLFFDSSKTSRIVFDYGEMSETYEGYTTCTRILAEDYQISVCMTKGADDA